MSASPSRGEARKHAIAAAALELYIERGFGVSIDEVAAAAGASKQTIYKFFGGRDGLAREAMALELEAVIGPMRAAAEGPGDPAARLSEFADAFHAVLFADRCLALYRFVIGVSGESPEFGIAFNETVVDYVMGLVAPLIAEARGASPSDAVVLAEQFIGTLQGTELNRALAGGEVDEARLAQLRVQALAALN